MSIETSTDTESAAAFSTKLLTQLGANSTPPVDQWDPPFCGDIDMCIHANGTWSYLGSPIGRSAMVKLFSSILRYEEDGCYYLVTPVEKVRITVEDVPLFVTSFSQSLSKKADHKKEEAQEEKRERATDCLIFQTSVDDNILLGVEHPLEMRQYQGQIRPYLHVRRNLYALVHRNVFYQLVDLATIEVGRAKIYSAGQWFDLGGVEC